MRFPLPPAEPSCSARWSTPAYEQELRAWVEGTLGPVRLERAKLRPWSTVWTAYGAEGLHWIKENCPACRFEAALLEVLNAVTPDRVVPLRALDREHGRLVLPDQGDVLGMRHTDLDSWCTIVREWALLQRELLAHGDRVAAVGVPALRVEDSEELLRERAEALHALPRGDARRLDEAMVRRIEAGMDDLRRSVDAVGALGLPLALNHNDLHGNNVFAGHPGDHAAPMRFFDLGDVMLTDPTGVLLVPLGFLVDLLGCQVDDSRLWQVAEAWVEVWSDLVPAAALRAALPHGMRLARLARHEAWLRVTPGMTPTERQDWGAGEREWLAAVPDRPLLGAEDVAGGSPAPAGS